MKNRSASLNLVFVVIFLIFSVFMAWYIPSITSIRSEIMRTRQDLETSEGRERKQQEEYDRAVEELPVIKQELSEKEPLAEELEQKVADLKARRKELRTEKKELETDKEPDTGKGGNSDDE